jgi:hypothetical protein
MKTRESCTRMKTVMNQRISESVNAMSENGKMGKRGPTFARGLPPPASATARQDGPAEQARVLPKKQSAAVERRNFFRLFPPFPPLTAFGGSFLFCNEKRRINQSLVTSSPTIELNGVLRQRRPTGECRQRRRRSIEDPPSPLATRDSASLRSLISRI